MCLFSLFMIAILLIVYFFYLLWGALFFDTCTVFFLNISVIKNPEKKNICSYVTYL